MPKLLFTVISWIIRKFLLLLLLIVALLLAPSVIEVWGVVGQFDSMAVAQKIKNQIEDLRISRDAPKAEIEQKLQILRAQLERKKVERTELDKGSCLLPTCSMVKSAKLYQVEMEVELLEQALIYVEAISKGKTSCGEFTKNNREINDRKRIYDELEQAKPWWAPTSREHLGQKGKIEDLVQKGIVLRNACKKFQLLPKTFEANVNSAHAKTGAKYEEFLARLEELKKSRSGILLLPLQVLPTALATLAVIIFVPIGIKLLSYYVVAVLASRKFGIRLLPDTSGALMVESASQSLQQINLEKGWELLIDPSLLRSSPDSATKRMKVLLDWRMPFSSIASGQYLLTRIREDGNGTITISDDKDDLSKITVLDLPENAALVLQPRCLAGIIQRVDRPIRITRPWRLGNLGSWLTLQLRYVVFHGPAKLIVRGNQGVEAAPAQAGSSINQAATLGFSANLGYGVARSEPFYAYLSGKTELFNDCFSSGPGYYLHEVRPRPAMKTLLPGRGIDGILNSLLKIFGL